MDCVLKSKPEQSGTYFSKNSFLNGTFHRTCYWTKKKKKTKKHTNKKPKPNAIQFEFIWIYLLRVNKSLSIKLLTLNESLMVKMSCLPLHGKIITMAWQKAIIKNQINAIEYLMCGCQTGFEKYFHLFTSVSSFTVWLSMTGFAFRKSI